MKMARATVLAILFSLCAPSSFLYATCTVTADFSYKDSLGVHYFKNLSTGGNRYYWNFGDAGGMYYGSDMSHTYNKFLSGFIRVKLYALDTNQAGCMDTISKVIYISGCKSAANFTVAQFGYKAVFTNNGIKGQIYRWTFGDGGSDTSFAPPSHTYSSTGSYAIKLIVTDTSKSYCKDSATKIVTIPGCKVKSKFWVYDSATIFDFGNGSSAANKFLWKFGDGNSSSAQTPNYYIYSNPGTYTITLYAWDTNYSGCVDSSSFTVNGGCQVNGNWTYTKYGLNKVYFYPANSAATNYYWQFGNGATSTAKNPVVTYAALGSSYSVKLVTWNNIYTGCRDSSTKQITVGNCNVMADFSYTISGKTVYFLNKSVNGNTYAWKFGTSGTSTTKSPPYTFSTAGTNTVRLITKDTSGKCSDTSIQTIVITNCKARAVSYVYPQGLKIMLNSLSTDVNRQLWTFGDGQSSTDHDPEHTYSSAGTYSVKLKVYDTTIAGCSDSVTHSVTLTPCYINASFGAYDTLGKMTFYNSSFGANKYLWIFGDGTTSTDTAKQFEHNYAGPARFFLVRLIAWDTAHMPCSDATQYYVYSNGCKAGFDIVPDTSNQFSALVVENSRAGSNTSYVWDFGDGDTSHVRTPSHTYAGTGPYVLCLTIYDSMCTSTYCDTLGFDSSGSILAMRPFSIRVTYPGENYNGSTSVEEHEYSDVVKVFPNPAGNSVTVTSNGRDIKQVNLVDIQGKVILRENTADRSKEINLSAISPGLYFIEVVFDNHKTGRIKLIKN